MLQTALHPELCLDEVDLCATSGPSTADHSSASEQRDDHRSSSDVQSRKRALSNGEDGTSPKRSRKSNLVLHGELPPAEPAPPSSRIHLRSVPLRSSNRSKGLGLRGRLSRTVSEPSILTPNSTPQINLSCGALCVRSHSGCEIGTTPRTSRLIVRQRHARELRNEVFALQVFLHTSPAQAHRHLSLVVIFVFLAPD